MGFLGDAAKTAGNVATGGLANFNGGLTGKGNGGPSAPDFNAAATPNMTNAFGSSSNWTKGPDGKYSLNQSFSGPLSGASQGLQGQFAAANANPLDNGAQARQHAEDAIYAREKSRLDPQFANQEQGMRSQLAAQGLDPNSEAFNKEYDTFNRGKNDAYSSAMQNAIMGGGQEASRQQGMDLQSRMAPLMGLQGMGQLTGQGQNPLLPASLAQYQGDLQKYGIQQQGKNSSMSGLTNLAAMAAMAG